MNQPIMSYSIGDFVEPIRSDITNANNIWMIYWLSEVDKESSDNVYELVQVTKHFEDVYWIEFVHQNDIKRISFDDPRITDFMRECRKQRLLENYSLFKAKKSEYWTTASFNDKDHHWN